MTFRVIEACAVFCHHQQYRIDSIVMNFPYILAAAKMVCQLTGLLFKFVNNGSSDRNWKEQMKIFQRHRKESDRIMTAVMYLVGV